MSVLVPFAIYSNDLTKDLYGLWAIRVDLFDFYEKLALNTRIVSIFCFDLIVLFNDPGYACLLTNTQCSFHLLVVNIYTKYETDVYKSFKHEMF